MNEAERFLRERLARQPQAEAEATVPPIPAGPQRCVSLGTAWKHYWTRWTFKGRASRSEYWGAALMLALVQFAIGITLGFTLALCGMDDHRIEVWADGVGLLWNLATLVPGFCVWVRRLHDTNHSGWWAWLALIPIVGWIVLFVFAVRASDPRPNRYGPVPNTEP